MPTGRPEVEHARNTVCRGIRRGLLARARLDDVHRFRNRFDYGDIIDVSESQVETVIADAEALLHDVLRAFPKLRPAAP